VQVRLAEISQEFSVVRRATARSREAHHQARAPSRRAVAAAGFYHGPEPAYPGGCAIL